MLVEGQKIFKKLFIYTVWLSCFTFWNRRA